MYLRGINLKTVDVIILIYIIEYNYDTSEKRGNKIFKNKDQIKWST